MKKIVIVLLFLYCSLGFYAQQVPTIGISDVRPATYAFTNAKIIIDYQTSIVNGTLLIKDGLIVNIGNDVVIPNEAIVIDLNGKYIYPSFIDMYTSYGLPKVSRARRDYGKPQQVYSNQKRALNWNDAINSDYNAVDEFSVNKKANAALRKLGFGTVLSFKPDGISRGTATLVSLTDNNENKAVIEGQIAAHYSFNKGSSSQNYPASLFGSIALLRQTYLDAKWYNSLKQRKYTDVSLSAWNNIQTLPQIFDTDNKLNLIRADKIGDEFGVQYIIKGNGDEYQMMDQIKATNASLIMPLEFPKAYKIRDIYDAEQISLKEMKHWEMAPYVYGKLEKNNINFALTTSGLKDKSAFMKNIRKAIKSGLSEEAALKALTHTPAKLLRIDDRLGSLQKGMLASFIITSGNVFNEKTTIYENWVQGEKYLINDMHLVDYSGEYQISIDQDTYALEISGKAKAPAFTIVVSDTVKIKAKGKISGNQIYIAFKESKDQANEVRLSGWIGDKTFKGTGFSPAGTPINWEANYTAELKDQKKKPSKDINKETKIGEFIYPFTAHGLLNKPTQNSYLIKNATVWTNEQEGILENTDVLLENGKITKVGKGLSKNGVTEIDGTGLHLTSGVIDEHSHIAMSGGGNEFSHAVSSEVRIGDIINPEDINIYRQLSGGVTAAQTLHGSANPIGGQSALIKHRWGVSPDELLVNDGAPFLKLALGENVKQSRNPSYLATRFPTSRMGVEAIIRDAFQQASDYKKEWDKYKSLSAKEKAKAQRPRTDLRMEALMEVLEEKRFITCHAYVQSETNMIMKLAEDFGIKAHTLIHNTEGYKIADKIKEHGAYASNLPDWWSYKFEVYQAIPYNSAIQAQQGITVAIHSDNPELARRLNQEAAKTVKYGGLSQEEAWKLVTLNPAKILHLDHRMGSIKTGKDADLVLWTENPLSMYAIVDKTMVDGIVYYDREKDKEMQAWIKEERNRLINKMNQEK